MIPQPASWQPTPWRGWGLAAYACAAAFTLGVTYLLFKMPFQLSDNLANLLQVRNLSFSQLVESTLFNEGYLRPMLWVALKGLFVLAPDHPYAVFKTFHAIELGLVMVLFVRALGVSNAVAFAAVPLSCAVLIGLHTFQPLLWQAFPINNFLTVALCCVAAFNLSLARPSAMAALGAVALLVIASLTVESGLLVWVCLVAAFVAGARGVSGRGLLVATGVVAAYFVFRFGWAGAGAPGLSERSTGFGFGHLDEEMIAGRFGTNPLPLYAYNIFSSALTVLFGEPRRGRWYVTAMATGHAEVQWPAVWATVTLTATSLLVVWQTLKRLPFWLKGGAASHERALIVFWAMLAANAVISFPYTKDEIMSPAGLFYAFAVHVVFTDAVAANPRLVRVSVRSLAATAALALLGSAWTWRAVDVGHSMHLAAVRYRGDWARLDDWMERNPGAVRPGDDEFIRRLEAQAITTHVPHPGLTGWRGERVFDER